MAKLRKGKSYRKLERPYTRKSKYKKKSFVKAVPNNHVVRHEMGSPNEDFEYTVLLRSKDALQIRHNAMEAARKSANVVLERKCGINNFYFKYRIYAHHVLRENPIAAGAGADRMSTGMKRSFGKSVGLAAQVQEGQVILEISVDEENLDLAKKAANRAKKKMACSCWLDIQRNDGDDE